MPTYGVYDESRSGSEACAGDVGFFAQEGVAWECLGEGGADE